MAMMKLKSVLIVCSFLSLLPFIFGAGCPNPCQNNSCDDGLYCNGVEVCTVDGNQAVCSDGTLPCDESETCNEETDSCEVELQYTCNIDTTKTGYELAADYDGCLVWNAQKIMAHIESEDIDIQSTELNMSEFSSSNADINADENWIKATYTVVPEDMSAYPDAPGSINGVVLAKLKSKDKIDYDFGFSNDETQGTCADVQQDIYDTVLNAVLTPGQRNKYEAEGKSLSFIQDDDLPPLDDSTNPVNRGSAWLDVDPADKVTREGDKYSYEPLSLYVEHDDPTFEEDRYRGVRYCKWLTHQAILSWMLEKSFEDDPVLITPTIPECDQPSSLETEFGSCLFYFVHSESYFCSDYTGRGFASFEETEAKCNSRDATGTELSPIFKEVSCSERTEEIEATIPGYQGHTGICVVHCQADNEFIWNIYTDDPESLCEGFVLFYPEDFE